MIPNITTITAEALCGQVRDLKKQGYRLVTMTCVDIDETTVEVLYHFDKDLQMVHLRMPHAKATPIPSISDIYFAAFLVENEMQDHFGICFKDLVIDYGQTLYLEDEVRRTPFCKYSVAHK